MRYMGVAAIIALTGCSHARGSDTEAVRPFAWLEGCWITESGDTREVWTSAGDGLLFGFNTVTRDDQVVFFEQLRLESTSKGWAYFAYPSGEGPVAFSLAQGGRDAATFQNGAHDYPQIIGYARKGDRLTATAALKTGEREQGWMFRACPQSD